METIFKQRPALIMSNQVVKATTLSILGTFTTIEELEPINEFKAL